MRVALLGFLHESNTFHVHRTTYSDFESNSLTRGEAMIARWTGVRHELGGMIAQCSADGIEIAGGMAALGTPSGTITAESYERFVQEFLLELRSCGQIDGVLAALHGATVSENVPDADGELLVRIRSVVGASTPIIATLDLHANVSQQMVQASNVLIAYRSNPHLDQFERGQEAATLMRRTLAGEVRPVQALVTPPLVIPISCQFTDEMPARGLYDDLRETLEIPGILSASICMGFYFADVSEMGASFLAVADSDAGLAHDAALRMANRAWQRKEEFTSHLPDAETAVRAAMNSTRTPVVLLDIGDNVGGGGVADSTILLEQIVRQKAHGALVVLYDPEAVNLCLRAGIRSAVEIRVGGKTDLMHGAPVNIKGRVQTLSDGIFTETQVRHSGWRKMDQGVTAVVDTEEDHSIVLISQRVPPYSLEQVLSLGIHPERKKILVVKGVIAPRAAYAPVAGEIVPVDTPGITSNNPERFNYQHRRIPLYPLEPNTQFEAGS